MTKGHRRPSLTVDAIVMDREGRLLLIERGKEPFKGSFALPGGFVDYGERVEEAVIRELEEETGLVGRVVRLVGVYSDPERDPRGHTVSVVFHLEIVGGQLKAGDDAVIARYHLMDRLPPLAFDHDKIIVDFLDGRCCEY